MRRADEGHVSPAARIWGILFQAFVATYGGYFGAGIGILMLASLSLMGLQDIHRMNALKTALAFVINGVALVFFALSRIVNWPLAVLMGAGGLLGGVLERHGKGAISAYIGNPTAHNFSLARYVGLFMGLSQLPVIYSAGTVDQWPKNVSCMLMYGHMWWIPTPDVQRTQYWMILGGNPQASQGSLLACPDLLGEIDRIRARGGKVVVLDPRRTRTAEESDEHVFIRPGTDAALVAAMAYVMETEGLVARAFLETHTLGYGPYREYLLGVRDGQPKAPQWAEAISGVPAETIVRLMPSIEQLRLVSSGTEAAMSALRLARGATGRRKIVKFEGCYHGHADGLLVKAGSGALTFGHPSSAGVPAEITQHTLALDYNDAQQLEDAFRRHGDDIACVIVEPVAGNMNLVRGTPEFLRTMRALCTKHGAILIFDEVMSGFRVAMGGAQSLYGIEPDMTVLGKVIGGGMPVAAFGGRREVMKHLAPLGPVYQAGTLSGNPVAVACGLATLKLVQAPGFYDRLAAQTRKLVDGLARAARDAKVDFCADAVGGMFGVYFANDVPASYAQVMACDKERFNRFFHAMLARGVYLAPSAFEAGFVSAAHDDAAIDATVAAAREAFALI